MARHGEGLAAAYVPAAALTTPTPGPGPATTRSLRRGATALGRRGRLVAGPRLGDPVVIVVD